MRLSKAACAQSVSDNGMYQQCPPSMRATTAPPAASALDFISETLRRGPLASAQHDVRPTLASKLTNKVLLLDNSGNATGPSSTALRQRAAQRSAKDRPCLSRRRRHELGLLPGPLRKVRRMPYEAALPLRAIWRKYFEALVLPLCGGVTGAGGGGAGAGAGQQPPALPVADHGALWRCFATADFHGCEFAVLRATGQGRVGATGIVVHETERTFRVVTPEDKLLVLPKDGAEFGFRAAGYAFSLPGNLRLS